MMRFKGPIARQNQYLFASDWEFETGEDISALLKQAIAQAERSGRPLTALDLAIAAGYPRVSPFMGGVFSKPQSYNYSA